MLKDGWTALIVAVKGDSTTLVEILLRSKANPNLPDEVRGTGQTSFESICVGSDTFLPYITSFILFVRRMVIQRSCTVHPKTTVKY